jgi:hypothetical protein
MLLIDGTKYLTEKEISGKYGISEYWLRRQRYLGNEPVFFKIRGKGKVFYPEIETDEWFKTNIKQVD